MSVIRYSAGGTFNAHFDFLNRDADDDSTSALARRRLGSLIIYLNDPEIAGSTFFPDAGMEFYPRRGNASLFTYDADDIYRRLTKHAGVPVSGTTKWIAVLFLTDRPMSVE